MSNQEELILVVPALIAGEVIDQSNGHTVAPAHRDGFHAASEEALFTLREHASFVARGPAEENPDQKQLIVYAVVGYQGKVLGYKRGKVGAEPRLHAMHSIGVGGHINPEDWDLGADGGQAFNTALHRELAEEVGIMRSHISGVRFIGLVNEDITAVGQVHLGLVYFVELAGVDNLKFEEALVDPRWLDDADLGNAESFEVWSKLVGASLLGPCEPGLPLRPDYQQRVIDEKHDLDVRLDRWTTFLHSPKFDEIYVEERERLIRQHHLMVELSSVLGERINAFP